VAFVEMALYKDNTLFEILSKVNFSLVCNVISQAILVICSIGDPHFVILWDMVEFNSYNSSVLIGSSNLSI